MNPIFRYVSPLGLLLLEAGETGLVGVRFFKEEIQYDPRDEGAYSSAQKEVFRLTALWLDDYFAGKTPPELPPLQLTGTPFSKMVWEQLLAIPYGETITYGQLAALVAQKLGRAAMSAQAIGGAVGRNPVCIIVPCHRVVGADGNLTGFRDGIENKIALLKLEGHDMRRFSMPKKRVPSKYLS